jgi:hypothetical protein
MIHGCSENIPRHMSPQEEFSGRDTRVEYRPRDWSAPDTSCVASTWLEMKEIKRKIKYLKKELSAYLRNG